MIVDLFAGPGGWDEGLRLLGRHEDCVGIEWDEAACKTAIAAGHQRIRTDVATYPLDAFAPGEVEGLIASPPCQSFSTAGKQKGRADKEHVIACALELAAGFDSRYQYGGLLQDERSMLTVEPLRWALALRPRWIALEQVPAVLELWTLFAQILTEHGYHTAAGILTAEQYGVPQTRKRAYMVASLDGPVQLPEPTHSRYYGRDPKRLDPGLLPWVSMARALGWGEGHVVNTRGERRTSGGNEFDADTPSRALTGKARSWALRMTTMPNSARRPLGAPAPTIAFGHDAASAKWVPDSTRELQRPDRPATTIACDPRVFQPGGHHTPGSQAKNAVRITVEEASVLMGFRPDYPWQGSRSKQFEQVGNAVCPPMGAKVLAEAMRLSA